MSRLSTQERATLARRLDYALKDVELAVMTGHEHKVSDAVDHLRMIADESIDALTSM